MKTQRHRYRWIAFACFFMLLGCFLSCTGQEKRPDELRPTVIFKEGLDVVTRWRVQLTDRPPMDSSPIEYGTVGFDAQFVYAASRDRLLYKVRRSNGDVVWKIPLSEELIARPVVHKGMLYVGTVSGNLAAFDAQSGAERWRFQTGDAIMVAPVVHDGLVYVVNQNDKLIALEADTGAWVWEHREEYYGNMSVRRHSAPVVDGDTVYVGSTSGLIAAFDKNNGNVLWKRGLAEADRFNDIDSTPIVADGRLYTASFNGSVYSLNATTGKPLWKRELKGSSSLSLVEGRLYVGASESGLYCLDLRDGSTLWYMKFDTVFRNKPEGEISRPVPYRDAFLAFTTSENSLYFVNHYKKKLIARFATGTGISSEPLVAGNDVYVLSNGGYLYSLALGRKGTPYRKKSISR